MSLISIWDIQVFIDTIHKLRNLPELYQYASKEIKYEYNQVVESFNSDLINCKNILNNILFEISQKETIINKLNEELNYLESKRYEYENKEDYITTKTTNSDGSVSYTETKVSYDREIQAINSKIATVSAKKQEETYILESLQRKKNDLLNVIERKEHLLNELKYYYEQYSFDEKKLYNNVDESIEDGINILNNQIKALNDYVGMHPSSSNAFLMGYHENKASYINRLETSPKIVENGDNNLLLNDLFNYIYSNNIDNSKLIRSLDLEECTKFILTEFCHILLAPLGYNEKDSFSFSENFINDIKIKYPQLKMIDSKINTEIYFKKNLRDFDFNQHKNKLIFCDIDLLKQTTIDEKNKIKENNIILITVLPDFNITQKKIKEWRENNYDRF